MASTQYVRDRGHIAYHADGRAYERESPCPRALKNGETVIGEEIVIIRGDGTKGVILVSASPIKDALGETVAGIVVEVDITAQKDIEEALAASHSQIQSIIDNTPDVMYAVNLDGSIRFANKAAANLFGATPQDIIGKTRPGGNSQRCFASVRGKRSAGH